MTERQRLIARKQAMQAAKNKVRKLEGIQVLDLFERETNIPLNEAYRKGCFAICSYSQLPHSRLPHGSSASQIAVWILQTMDLQEGYEYFYEIGSVWARIKIFNLPSAVPSLWEAGHYGFLLIDTDFSQIQIAGFDSRDEDHYLIDIIKL